jgi:hypothetical protein
MHAAHGFVQLCAYKAGVMCQRSRVLLACFAVFVWLIGCAYPLLTAAQGNDIAAPAGGRATLMGNTGVALGRDGSAPFYNSATIVRIRDERLAFAVNFYSLTLSHLPAWHQPDKLDADRFGKDNLQGTSLFDINFRPLPSTLCLFFTLEELAALSLDPSADAADAAANRDATNKAPTGKKLALSSARD